MIYVRFLIYLLSIIFLSQLPAAAQTGSEDPETDFRTARELSFAGEYDRAIQIYNRLLEVYPQNADYLLGKGQALLWSGDAGGAIPVLEQGLELAPEYEDIYRALAQAHESNREPQQAAAVYRQARDKFGSPAWTTRGLVNASRDTGSGINLKLTNHMEYLSNHSEDWRDTTIAVTGNLDKSRQVTLTFTNSSRFGLIDNTVSAESYLPVNENNLLYAEIRYSGSHNVLPELSAHLQLAHSFRNGWGFIGGYKRVEYTESGVNLFDLGLEYYFGNYRVAYTSVISDSDTAGNALSHRFQAGYTFNSLSNIQLAVTTGAEVEKPVNARSIIKTDFTNISLWGEYRLNSNWTFIYAAGFTDLTVNNLRSSNRKSFNLGVQYNY